MLAPKRSRWYVLIPTLIVLAGVKSGAVKPGSEANLGRLVDVYLEKIEDPPGGLEQRIKHVAALLRREPAGFGRSIEDRTAWKRLSEKQSYRKILSRAESFLKEPIPDSPDDLYRTTSRTGDRPPWAAVSRRRRGRIRYLVLAECLQDEGRFLPAFEEMVRAVCSERVWVHPVHDHGLRNFDGKQMDIDLDSSLLAGELATAYFLLGDRLSPETRTLIRENIRRRVLEPFREMVTGRRYANLWVTTSGNWNAVCQAGVVVSALATLDSPQERAFFVVAVEAYSKHFLEGFPGDGYCTEGVGYWNYGFGHYLILSEAIYQATGGAVDLLDSEAARRPATYGARTGIINDIYPAFADCKVGKRPDQRVMYFASRRFGLGLRGWENLDMVSAGGPLFEAMMYSFPNSASERPPADSAAEGPGLRTWFDEAGILIGRPGDDPMCRVGVAMKGGHNAEHHNHNDVGSYVVVIGQETPLVDPGPEVYTRRTFGSRRYESKISNSYGHPVPVVAGKLQEAGREAKGRILKTDFTDQTDTLVVDLRSAYDVPELQALTRTFIYSRKGTGSFAVIDEVTFTKPASFATALITLSKWKRLDADSLLIHGEQEAVRVDIQVSGGDSEIHAEEINEQVRTKTLPIRLGIDLKAPVLKATITMRITPTATGQE